MRRCLGASPTLVVVKCYLDGLSVTGNFTYLLAKLADEAQRFVENKLSDVEDECQITADLLTEDAEQLDRLANSLEHNGFDCGKEREHADEQQTRNYCQRRC